MLQLPGDRNFLLTTLPDFPYIVCLHLAVLFIYYPLSYSLINWQTCFPEFYMPLWQIIKGKGEKVMEPLVCSQVGQKSWVT